MIKKYLKLFWDFFKIGLFTFGGGYAMISIISTELADKRGYVSQQEFSDVVAIAESTPGPIAINSATYIGYRVGGFFGAVLSSVAVSLPSFIIIFIISVFLPRFLEYQIVQNAFRGVQCAVVVLIITASVKLFKNVERNLFSFALIAFSAVLLIVFNLLSINVSTIYFILVAGVLGVCYYYPKAKKLEKEKNATESEEQSLEGGNKQ